MTNEHSSANAQNSGNLVTQGSGSVDNLLREADKSAGFERRMTFKQGLYYCDGSEIPLGTKFIAQCVGWCMKWIKFVDKRPVDGKVYRIYQGEQVPGRDAFDDRDDRLWPKDKNNRPQDPWTLQYLLPMVDPETDELMIFSTSSKGGARAVSDLVRIYARRSQRDPKSGQPIIKLAVAMMPTTDYGKVQRPSFDVIGWDDGTKIVREVSDETLKKADFNDEIPFDSGVTMH